MSTMKNIVNVRVDDDLKAKLKKIAMVEHLKVAQLIRQILYAYVERREADDA